MANLHKASKSLAHREICQNPHFIMVNHYSTLGLSILAIQQASQSLILLVLLQEELSIGLPWHQFSTRSLSLKSETRS